MKGKFKISSLLQYADKDNNDDHKKKQVTKIFSCRKSGNDAKEPSVSFLSLYRYASSLDKTILIFGAICAIITGTMEVFNTLFMINMMSKLIQSNGKTLYKNLTEPNILKEDEFVIEAASDFAITVSILGLLCIICNWFIVIAFNHNAQKQIFMIRKKFFESVLNQDFSWYDKHNTGAFAAKMSEDLIKLEDGIGEKVSIFINYQVIFIGHIILALVIGWEMTIVSSTFIVLGVLATRIFSRINSKLAQEETAAYSSAGALAEEVLSSIQTVAAFGGENKELKHYSEKLERAHKINTKRGICTSTGVGFSWILCYSSLVIGIWYGIRLMLNDNKDSFGRVYNVRTILMVLVSLFRGIVNFNMSYPFIEIFGIATGAGANIFNIISSVSLINASKNKGIKPSFIKGKIVFKDVHFHYPSRSQVPILRGLNLTINAGETVALVGSSGCGKSTCVNLIQRFYDLTSGSIHLDDNNIRDLNLVWLRSNIGLVEQEPKLFSTTIAENMKFGNRDATQEDIEKAAKTANVHDFIKSLPLGYDTVIGERGTQLSGGQKQRIAIARALVRNPSIMLLDEATSALDANSEAKVQAALDQASKERTTIIVAHRLSTIRNADQIVVLSEGKIVEKGKHDELMALKKDYYKLVTSQVTSDNVIKYSALETDNEELEVFNNITKESLTKEEIKQEQKSVSKISLWGFMKMNAQERSHILVATFFSFLMGFKVPLLSILYGEIIQVLATYNNYYIRTHISYYYILLALLGLYSGIVSFMQTLFFGLGGGNLVTQLRRKMFRNILQQKISWFDYEENGTGALCSRLSLEVARVQSVTGQSIAAILQATSTLIVAIVTSLYFNYKLGIIACLMVPVILVLTFIQNKISEQSQSNYQQKIVKANNIAVDAIAKIRTVVSLGCEDTIYNIYVSELTTLLNNIKHYLHMKGLIFGLIKSMMFFETAICIYYGTILTKYDGISYIIVIQVTLIMLTTIVYVGIGYAFFPNLQNGLKSVTKINKYVNLKPSIQDSSTAQDKDWKQGNIKYDRINFSYPTRQEIPVLKDFNLAVAEGKTIALVGPSGCGKSTIIQLLQRFYDPQSGQIAIDNDDIKNVTLHKLRSQMGVVSQEATLFDRSITENIAYGDNSRVVTKTEIMAAAQMANIHNFIVSLPLGYETRLGRKGIQISGGQKQRIAIARALIRNPKILLLDEATSALDIENEKIVQETLDKAKKGRTCITIAHRLTTIQDADIICVINKGKIAELGSHDELMNRGGLYYKLHA